MYQISVRYWILSIIFAGIIGSLSAQDSTIGRVSIASPNAASLGKYGDIPVGYNTGIPQVGVPLYTIKSGSLQLPISVSYHAGGLKVQEQASWVGAGWSLNAGGVITRTVVGAPDDRGINAAHTTYGHFSDYGYSNYLFTVGGSPCGGTGVPCPTGSLYPADDVSISAGVKDGEPDLYFFNFNGYTGKFYFNDDRTPILVPEQDFKIKPLYPYTTAQVSPIGMPGFIITTPDGKNYYFGKNQSGDGNPDAIEITTDLTSQASSNTQQGAVSSWFLNKIVSADGMDSIKLIYQPDNFSYYTVSMFPIFPGPNQTFLGSNYEYDLVKNFVKGVALTKILFSNGEVDIRPGLVRKDVGDYTSMVIADVANTQSTALGSILITDNNGFCKKDSFSYSYFVDSVHSLTGFFGSNGTISAINSDKYRLKLDSIQEIACDGSAKVPPYRFSYFSEQVPRKLSFGVDHWGFCNGINTNNKLIPTYYLTSMGNPSVMPGADRDAHWPAMRAGALSQITYPTGGSTQFNFEANDTYCNYTTYTSQSYGFSAGYDGSSRDTSYFSTPATSGVYQIILTNDMASSSASVSFGTAGSFYVAAGATDSSYLSLTPSTIYMIITTISYPVTGHGVSGTFIHFIPTSVAANVPVGGLRIKTMTTSDGVTANNIVTSYGYTNGGGTQSSGILYSRPVYVQELRNDVLHQVGPPTAGSTCSANGCVTCDGSTSNAYYASPSSIRPMGTSQGNHIGYNEVHVSQTGNGSSTYRYYGSNTWDYVITDVCTRNIDVTSCSLSFASYPSAPLPFEYLRGELKYEAHYKQSGNILKDVWYFPKYLPDSILTPGLIIQNAPSSGGTAYRFGTEYMLQSAAKIKDSTLSTQYDSVHSSSLTTTTVAYYNSPFHHQLTRKVITTSTGDSLVTNSKYAADFRVASCDTISNAWHNYMTAYIADSLTYYSQLISCTNTGGWNCKYIAYQQYRFDKSTARKSYVSLRRTNYSDSGNRFSACLLTATNAADTILKPILRLQDEYNNAAIEQSDWKNTNLRRASFTKYDTSVSPVGFAYPGRTRLLSLQGVSSSFTNAAVSGNTLTMDSRYLDESYFKFAGGNPLQVLTRQGVPDAYLWDYSNTQPVAKVSNATADQVAYTSFEADGTGNWTISGGTPGTTGGFTGKKFYTLSTGNTISKSGLPSATNYVVSYWARSGPLTISGTTAVSGLVKRGWTFYQHALPAGSTSVSISGAGVTLDELRLHPTTAQMTTYTYSPLVGMTSACSPNNLATYYEYDGLGRLAQIRDIDSNILKKYDYQYQYYTTSVAVWQANGVLRCKPCPANAAYITNMQQHQEVDVNGGSPTYNTTRWIDDGIPGSCVINPDWENTTTAIRCQQSLGANDGYQEQEQKDLNPCSSTYNTLRWVTLGLNATACPFCNSSNCSGTNHKCFSNTCQTGTLGVISQTQSGTGSNTKCTTQYGYFFSDGSYIYDHTTVVNGTCLAP